MPRKNNHVFPYLLEDRTGTIPQACPILAVGESFEAIRVVYKDLWPEVKVRDHAIVRAHIVKNRESSVKENSIYYLVPPNEIELERAIRHLRYMALEYNATPEAIRLLNELSPFSEEEKKIMAEKLKAKATAAKPDKEGLKSAAKKTPVGGASAKPRGNAAALAKARAARNSGPDMRKVTGLIKPKDIAARAGTFRYQMLSDLLGSKNVQEFRDKDPKYDAGCLRYAESANIVKLG